MANFWVQVGEKAICENKAVDFGDLVKPFGRKYKGMWRIFGISEYGEIMLVSNECIGEIRLSGFAGYSMGVDRLDQLCIDTVKSSKVAAVRSITGLDISKLNEDRMHLLLSLFGQKYWLATEFKYSSAISCVVGLEAIVDDARIDLPLEAFEGSHHEYDRTLGVRAIVTLRKNVEFHRTKQGYWEI